MILTSKVRINVTLLLAAVWAGRAVRRRQKFIQHGDKEFYHGSYRF